MRRLIASTFASLDGIMQAPGGPEEDSTGGFSAWRLDVRLRRRKRRHLSRRFRRQDRELVLGRRTYQIFEAVLALSAE